MRLPVGSAIMDRMGWRSVFASPIDATAAPGHLAPEDAPVAVPRLYRAVEGRLLGGVASGLGAHLGLSVLWMRIAFVVLNLGSGFGVLLYGAYWIIVPEQTLPSGQTREVKEHPIRQQVLRWGFALTALAVFVASLVQWLPSSRYFVPGGLSLLGVAFMWRQASEADRSQWMRVGQKSLLANRGDGIGVGRIVLGVALIAAGTIGIIAGSGIGAMRDGIIAAFATLTGVALITGPWWLRLVNDLGTERRARIRSQERADLAAHVHDSVLQTLALIQRSAESPREVLRLARGQERELRTLLYGQARESDRLATALAAIAAEVEDQYSVAIDQVVVGDAPGDPGVLALVQATREALVNAAKHAKVSTVSLYAEVEPHAIAVYIRDRGIGFDETTVPADRQGLRGSIRDRMGRHGGTAIVRSSPGAGTEVQLRMARDVQ
jgi:signal transduction histidine kinase/phage shock protein PspC (stress-responsive transcriptional regulator)